MTFLLSQPTLFWYQEVNHRHSSSYCIQDCIALTSSLRLTFTELKSVGLGVGFGVGFLVGLGVGFGVVFGVGFGVGFRVGFLVGERVGFLVGERVVGASVGLTDGGAVGAVGLDDGDDEGALLMVGVLLGKDDGIRVGKLSSRDNNAMTYR